MTFTDNPARDYERFCDAQDNGAGDEETPAGGYASVEAVDYTVYPTWKLYALGLESGASGEALKRPVTEPLGEEQWRAFEDGWKDGRAGYEEDLGKFQKAAALFLSDAEAEASAALAAAGDEEGWGSVPEERGKWLTNGTRDVKAASTVMTGYCTLAEEIAWRALHVQGPPKATGLYTREQLEGLGYIGFYKRVNANPRGAFWDGGEEPVRHEELYREDLEEPGE